MTTRAPWGSKRHGGLVADGLGVIASWIGAHSGQERYRLLGIVVGAAAWARSPAGERRRRGPQLPELLEVLEVLPPKTLFSLSRLVARCACDEDGALDLERWLVDEDDDGGGPGEAPEQQAARIVSSWGQEDGVSRLARAVLYRLSYSLDPKLGIKSDVTAIVAGCSRREGEAFGKLFSAMGHWKLGEVGALERWGVSLAQDRDVRPDVETSNEEPEA